MFAKRKFIVWLTAVTLLAAGLRLYKLDSPSFWIDECFTIRTCAHICDAPFRLVFLSKILGYMPTVLGLKLGGIDPSRIPAEQPEAWRAMGIDETLARLPSCLIGIATVPLLGLASRRMLGARAALIASLLLAVSPWHIAVSQEARFYGQQFLFYNLGMVLYFQATERPSRRGLAAAMACFTLAFLSQPTASLFVGVLVIDAAIGWARREPIRLGRPGWGIVLLALGVCGAILAFDVTRAPSQWTQFYDHSNQSAPMVLLATAWMAGPGAVVLGAAVVLGPGAFRQRRVRYLAIAASLPPVAVAIMALKLFVAYRYDFVCLFGVLSLAAIGCDRLHAAARPRLGPALALATTALLVIASLRVDLEYYTDGAGFRPRYREAFAFVDRHRRPGDAIYASVPDAALLARYYLQDADVRPLPKDSDSESPVDLGGQSAWFVYLHNRSIQWRNDYQRIADKAELKAVFDTRSGPFDALRVHYHDPRRAQSGASTDRDRGR